MEKMQEQMCSLYFLQYLVFGEWNHYDGKLVELKQHFKTPAFNILYTLFFFCKNLVDFNEAC